MTALEQEVEGEKLVSRQILEQTQRKSDALAAIKARLSGPDSRFDWQDARFDRLEAKLKGLRADLPKIVAETLREVLRERDC